MSKEADTLSEITQPTANRMAARLFLCVLVILVSLGDLAVLHWKESLYWFYSQTMAIIDLLAGLSLACVAPLGQFSRRWSLLWRQSLHWLGFLVLVYFLHDLLMLGVLTHRTAGLSMLALSGFVFYFSGLYVDLLQIVVGIVCLSMAASMVWLHLHVWLLVLPLCVLAVFVLLLLVRQHQYHGEQE